MAHSSEVLTFTWKIENFSMLPHQVNEHLKSPTFVLEALGNSRWCLWLFPKGDRRDESNGHVSLFLSRVDLDTNIGALKVGMRFVLQSVNVALRHSVSSRYTVIDVGENQGYCTFASLDFIYKNKNDYLPQDILTIRCQVWSPVVISDEAAVKPLIPYTVPNYIGTQSSARTRIEVQRRTLTWPITKAGELKKSGEKISIDSVNSLEASPALKISFYIDNDLSSEHAQIEILQTRSSPEQQGLFVKCKVTVVSPGKEYQHSLEDSHLFEANVDETWHFPPFILIDNIIDGKYIYVDDTLFLRCEFSFSCKGIEYHLEVPMYAASPFRGKESTPELTQLGSNIRRLFEREKFCDVEVRAGEKTFPCHKVVLCAQSPVFSAMFDHDMQEKATGVVEITDLNPRTLERVLTFQYLETVEDGLSTDELCELYSAADKYEIVQLQRRCSMLLLYALSVESVCSVLFVADSHHDDFLWTHAYEFVCVHSRDIFHSPQWTTFMDDHPTLARETMIKICIEQPHI